MVDILHDRGLSMLRDTGAPRSTQAGLEIGSSLAEKGADMRQHDNLLIGTVSQGSALTTPGFCETISGTLPGLLNTKKGSSIH
ncbi:MAG: hypothetical protein JWP27_2654 [Flaviaesturariibacter sp.]|nr:hypothetical protein [Flaviaesturariibacter sp.]